MSSRKVSPLLAELEAAYAKARAKALLTAIQWAGSSSNLAALAGLAASTGRKWAQRAKISVEGAKRLQRVQGFPLTVEEMCPGERLEPFVCPHCHRVSALQGERTDSLPSFNGRSKAYRDALRKRRKAQAAKANQK
jgi:hypothetical protein